MGGGGRLEEGNASMDMMYIQKLIKANHCVEHRQEGREWDGNWGRAQGVLCACIYHPELHQDV